MASQTAPIVVGKHRRSGVPTSPTHCRRRPVLIFEGASRAVCADSENNNYEAPMRLNAIFILLLSCALAQTHAAMRLEPLQETVADSQFGQAYANRQFSIATAINNNGQVTGYQRTGEGLYRSFGITSGDNPALAIVDTPDFIALSAGDAACFWIICSTEFPFGMAITETGALTSFVGAESGSSVIPGSLPFSRFPGSFVEENAHGVVATTQYSAEGQSGFFLGDFGVTPVPEVRWLVAINDNQPAQALGQIGEAGDCQVFGYGCFPDPDECDDDGDGHSNDKGVGHHSHGRGHGYGHDDCHDDAEMQRSPPTGNGFPALLAMNAEGGVTALAFPQSTDSGKITRAFALALNDSIAVLRADVRDGSRERTNQLFTCRFDPYALDVDGDGRVDCEAGLERVAIDGERELLTVLGFTLNNNGLLVGNGGFSASGIGLPMVADLEADTPTLTLLANYLHVHRDVQLSVITDINDLGEAVGYGYRSCTDQPEAVRILPAEPLAGDIRFVPASLERDTLIRPGQDYTLLPRSAGAAGSALFRYSLLDADSGQWQVQQDWSADPYTATAPAEETDLCVRVEVADSLDMTHRREQLLRYRVSNDPAPDSASGATPGSALPASPGDALADALPQIGSGGALALLLLLVRGRSRRQAA